VLIAVQIGCLWKECCATSNAITMSNLSMSLKQNIVIDIVGAYDYDNNNK